MNVKRPKKIRVYPIEAQILDTIVFGAVQAKPTIPGGNGEGRVAAVTPARRSCPVERARVRGGVRNGCASLHGPVGEDVTGGNLVRGEHDEGGGRRPRRARMGKVE